MADHTNMETLQARMRQDATRAMRASVVRRLLAECDPQPSDAALGYAGLLQRAQGVVTQELATVESTPVQPEEDTKPD